MGGKREKAGASFTRGRQQLARGSQIPKVQKKFTEFSGNSRKLETKEVWYYKMGMRTSNQLHVQSFKDSPHKASGPNFFVGKHQQKGRGGGKEREKKRFRRRGGQDLKRRPGGQGGGFRRKKKLHKGGLGGKARKYRGKVRGKEKMSNENSEREDRIIEKLLERGKGGSERVYARKRGSLNLGGQKIFSRKKKDDGAATSLVCCGCKGKGGRGKGNKEKQGKNRTKTWVCYGGMQSGETSHPHPSNKRLKKTAGG